MRRPGPPRASAPETGHPFLGVDPHVAVLDPSEIDRLVTMVKTPRAIATFTMRDRFEAVDRLLAHEMSKRLSPTFNGTGADVAHAPRARPEVV